MDNKYIENIVFHRINTTTQLLELDRNSGVEIDIRSNNGELLLSHDPIDPHVKYEKLDHFLNFYQNQFIVANIKESGVEEKVIDALGNKTNKFFLLDCEMPFIINNYKKLGKYLSIRYSKKEPIENVIEFMDWIRWIWIDTYDLVDFKKLEKLNLSNNKLALVSPERWNKDIDLVEFIKKIKIEKIKLDFIMTDGANLLDWKKYYFDA